MEIDEAFARLRRHWWVIALCLLVALTGTYAYLGTIPTTYTSKAILQASKDRIEVADQAASLVSTVQALATSPDVVRKAIRETGVKREISTVTGNIAVIGEGPSNYVGLSVRDTGRNVARKLTASISAQVVDQLNFSKGDSIRREVERLEERLAPLLKRKRKLQRLTAANPDNVQHGIDLGNVESTIAPIQTELDAKRAEESRIAEGRLISEASLPAQADPSGVLQILGLAGVLGLVVGVMISAIWEIASPSVPGARRVAKLLGEPLIGTLRGREGSVTDLGRRLRLAARHNRIDTIVLSGVQERVQPEVVVALQEAVWVPETPPVTNTPAANTPAPIAPAATDDARSTQSFPAVSDSAASDRANGKEAGPDEPTRRIPAATALAAWSSSTASGLGADDKTTKLPARTGAGVRAVSPIKEKQRRLRVVAIEDLDPAIEERRAGMVVLAPPASKMKQVRTVSDLVDVSGWPLLGVIADRGRGPIQR